MKRLITLCLLVLVTMTSAQFALGQCDISGTVAAGATTDPALPGWTYTLTINWDTGSQYALSHMDLLLDSPGGTCTCTDFVDALTWADPIGSSNGDP